jgi:hypothetical protein
MRKSQAIASFVIVSGTTDSNELDVSVVKTARGLAIYGPADAPSGTLTIQWEPTATGTDWRTLQSGGSDVTISTDKVAVVDFIGFRRMRIHSSASESGAAGTRTLPVVMVEEI